MRIAYPVIYANRSHLLRSPGRSTSPLMTVSGGMWHTYVVSWLRHGICRLGLEHPQGCVQQVHTSLVFNYLYSSNSVPVLPCHCLNKPSNNQPHRAGNQQRTKMWWQWTTMVAVAVTVDIDGKGGWQQGWPQQLQHLRRLWMAMARDVEGIDGGGQRQIWRPKTKMEA
jgi:hypothetical protein